ncbi:hypothetical protein GGG16DRAFT_61569 [Schizophyllum commune]
MTTPGEQQFYSVALMDALMAELPRDWVVGLLYDIACQIHLSAVKHGLFGAYLDRLRFAVAVFHAFGHDWPCQLIYHPRKCVGFGLTDGEGCERFWYSISKLIPYLRVAGFHLRKYTLNAQFAFATKDAIKGLGAWLRRKDVRLAEKRKEARILLDEAGDVADDESFIRGQWRAQNLGRQEMTRALEMHEDVERAAAEVEELKATQVPGDLEHTAALRAAEAAYAAAKARYDRKRLQLGVSARAELSKLVNDKILHRRANALVLLRRAQVGIMKRKMEVERVVRSHRNKNGENRLRKHVKTAAERREGTVKAIVSKYNKACSELLKLIKRQRTRKGACAVRPLTPLPKTGLWDLDIDNPCWDDLRFDSADVGAPPWMADDNVRKAIRGVLLRDRCAEEEARLAHERENVLQWFEEEWMSLRAAKAVAIGVPDAPALIHQIEGRRRAFLRLAVQWERSISGIRGPSEAELIAAREDFALASCDASCSEGESEFARTTRSGAAFSNVIALPDDVDIAQLFLDAEKGRTEQAGTHSENASVLTSLPSSRAPSPLSDLTEEDERDATDDLLYAGEYEDPAPQPSPSANHPGIGKNSKARKSQANRKRKRQEMGNTGQASKRFRADKVLNAFCEQAVYDFDDAPVTSTAFTCLRNAWEMGIPELEGLVGYKYLAWNGLDSGAVTVNPEQVVMAVLVGGGRGIDHLQLADALEAMRRRLTFAQEERAHRRGNFCVKAIGFSHGGGQKEPGPLKHSDKTQRELTRFLKLKPMRRIAHLNSGALQNWEPEIHKHYADTQTKLLGWKPRLRRFLNFPKSVWSCLTINFGLQTQTFAHRDFGNLSYGFCSITALGRFNPDRGGHIILRELRLVIRFPPGASIIIPSALLTHHNTRIAEHETRYSVTQYTAGAIFRFVEHDCKLDTEYYTGLDAAELQAARSANLSRWRRGVAMLSRLPKLMRDAAAVKGKSSSNKDC